MAAPCAGIELRAASWLPAINIIRSTYYGAAGGAIGRREGHFEDLPWSVYCIATGLRPKHEKRKGSRNCKGCGRAAVANSQYEDRWNSDYCPTCEAIYRAGMVKQPIRSRAWRARGKKGVVIRA